MIAVDNILALIELVESNFYSKRNRSIISGYKDVCNNPQNKLHNWVFPKCFHWIHWIQWLKHLPSKGFKPATSCVRNQDATTVPTRHRWEALYLNWPKFMLQWFITFPEFAEFIESLFHLGKTPMSLKIKYICNEYLSVWHAIPRYESNTNHNNTFLQTTLFHLLICSWYIPYKSITCPRKYKTWRLKILPQKSPSCTLNFEFLVVHNRHPNLDQGKSYDCTFSFFYFYFGNKRKKNGSMCKGWTTYLISRFPVWW